MSGNFEDYLENNPLKPKIEDAEQFNDRVNLFIKKISELSQENEDFMEKNDISGAIAANAFMIISLGLLIDIGVNNKHMAKMVADEINRLRERYKNHKNESQS